MSDTTNNGGPAFPASYYTDDGEWAKRDGMTLRDYFAVKAMHALVVEPPWSDGGMASVHSWSKGFKGSESCDRFAFAAYVMADAMLKARGQA